MGRNIKEDNNTIKMKAVPKDLKRELFEAAQEDGHCLSDWLKFEAKKILVKRKKEVYVLKN
jgi:hypothetical protein